MIRAPSSSTNRVGPNVSVIIPTFNREHFIGDAIFSVLSQDFDDFELIVVDDGSTDQTEVTISRFDDVRLIYVRQENQGRSQARNRALGIARGRYIAFLDSDDMYMPGKLSLQVDYLDRHEAIGMVYTSAHCIDYSGHPLDNNYIASVSGWIYKSIAFFRPVTITLPTVMVRRELFNLAGGFDENMHRFEDTDMWRRISKVTRIDAIPIFTCNLRTHKENSLAAQNPDQIINSLNYYVNKVMTEDASVCKLVRHRGVGHLYYYYARAFLTVPAWQKSGLDLLAISYRHWVPLKFYHFAVVAYHVIKMRVASTS